MTDFASRHAFKARAGQMDYVRSLPRGHAEIWYDQKRYVYDMRGAEPREFKAWMKLLWINIPGPRRRLTGAYPSYHVE